MSNKKRHRSRKRGINMENNLQHLNVTVKGINENDKACYFDFQCFCSSETCEYDKEENITYIALYMGNLLNIYHTEIVKIQKI